ncbi:hypothetical protein NDU88_001441 [Pleurodeles waltl]|uniref:Immunoglobulin domain-containing protein n=1 Tax=Pleurodeles waltl TaxID=8319 RepID=A0AAV7KWB4_PLEWA|nr:hypothetical protein NDU88_001441 [Pleurodeles waltl]
MKAFHWIWIPLLGCGVEASAGAEQPPVVINATVGAEVRFPVQIPDGFDIGEITWLFKGLTLVRLTPSNELIEKEKTFKGRVSVNGQNASLHIWNLRMEDGGEYRVEVDKKGEPTEREVRQYTLRIFSSVTAQVTIITGNETCNIILKCTEKGGGNVSYEWREGHVKTSKEPLLNFTLREGDDKLEVCCKVRNPASTSEECVIPWKEAIKGFNHSNCKPAGAPDGKSVLGYTGFVVGIVVVCLFGLAALAALVRCCKGRKEKINAQTVYAEVNKHKNGTQKENTDGPYEMEGVQTVYVEVQNTNKVEAPPTSANNCSTPKEDTGNTVYDKVQQPKVEAPPTSANNRSTPKEDTGNTVYDKMLRPKVEAPPTSANNRSTPKEDTGNTVYDKMLRPKVEAPPTSANNRSTPKEDTGNTVYDKMLRPKSKMDEKKNHLNGKPAPPYDEITRGNNGPDEQE